jgi:hypothetical protein
MHSSLYFLTGTTINLLSIQIHYCTAISYKHHSVHKVTISPYLRMFRTKPLILNSRICNMWQCSIQWMVFCKSSKFGLRFCHFYCAVLPRTKIKFFWQLLHTAATPTPFVVEMRLEVSHMKHAGRQTEELTPVPRNALHTPHFIPRTRESYRTCKSKLIWRHHNAKLIWRHHNASSKLS